MAKIEQRRAPAEIIGIPIPQPEDNRRYPLVPTLEMVIDRYTEMNYAAEAMAIYQNEQDEHPEIFSQKEKESEKHYQARQNIRSQAAFIQTAFEWREPEGIAPYLGITPGQVERKQFRGRRKKEPQEKFHKRLRGMFAISSILKRYVKEALDGKAAIAKVNGLISDVRLRTIMKAGMLNVATCITQATARQWESAQDHQVDKAQIGAHSEIPDEPYDLQDSTPEGNDYQETYPDDNQKRSSEEDDYLEVTELDGDQEPSDSDGFQDQTPEIGLRQDIPNPDDAETQADIDDLIAVIEDEESERLIDSTTDSTEEEVDIDTPRVVEVEWPDGLGEAAEHQSPSGEDDWYQQLKPPSDEPA